MKKFEDLSEFQESFYISWYNMLNIEKQIIVFPELVNKPDQEIERISGQKRKYSALDKFVEMLEQHRESELCILSNSNLNLEMKKTGKEFKIYLDFWVKNFGRLGGTNPEFKSKA